MLAQGQSGGLAVVSSGLIFLKKKKSHQNKRIQGVVHRVFNKIYIAIGKRSKTDTLQC